MWPTLKGGDRARLEPVRLSVPERGEVVVARIRGAFVAHRVLSVDGDRLLLGGDNCVTPDPWVPMSDLLGRVVEVEREGRLLSRGEWDRGPSWLGRARLWAKRRFTFVARRAA